MTERPTVIVVCEPSDQSPVRVCREIPAAPSAWYKFAVIGEPEGSPELDKWLNDWVYVLTSRPVDSGFRAPLGVYLWKDEAMAVQQSVAKIAPHDSYVIHFTPIIG